MHASFSPVPCGFQEPEPQTTYASGIPLRVLDYELVEQLNLPSSGSACRLSRAYLSPDLLPYILLPAGITFFHGYDPSTADLAISTQHEFTALPRNLPSPDFDALRRQLRHALATEPLLDGHAHAAERLLALAFYQAPLTTADWVMHDLVQATDAEFGADLLRLLSRFRPHIPSWRAEIVRIALASPNLLLRDAALQAIEAWRDAELLSCLRSHREPVTWLARYAKQVILDLEH